MRRLRIVVYSIAGAMIGVAFGIGELSRSGSMTVGAIVAGISAVIIAGVLIDRRNTPTNQRRPLRSDTSEWRFLVGGIVGLIAGIYLMVRGSDGLWADSDAMGRIGFALIGIMIVAVEIPRHFLRPNRGS